MFENIFDSITRYFSNAYEYVSDAVMYFFYEYLGLSVEDLRLIALILILTTFSFLIIITFLIYLKSLMAMVKGEGNPEKVKMIADEKQRRIDNEQKLHKNLDEQRAEELEIEYELLEQEDIKIVPMFKYNLGLILDMLSRGVTEFKTTQAMMMKAKGQPQEQILQIVGAVKEFVALCTQDVFKSTLQENGPNEKDALKDMIMGDNSTTLALIIALMEKEVRRAEKLGNKKKKESIFKRLSDTICIFGTLASVDDPILATKSFEMAIELNPENMNAWSRAADMYYQTSRFHKAEWTYKKIIDEADYIINRKQIANANVILSKYYYDQENIFEAEKLYNISKPYYDELGISTDLNEREKEVLEYIEENQAKNVDKTILRVFEKEN